MAVLGPHASVDAVSVAVGDKTGRVEILEALTAALNTNAVSAIATWQLLHAVRHVNGGDVLVQPVQQFLNKLESKVAAELSAAPFSDRVFVECYEMACCLGPVSVEFVSGIRHRVEAMRAQKMAASPDDSFRALSMLSTTVFETRLELAALASVAPAWEPAWFAAPGIKIRRAPDVVGPDISGWLSDAVQYMRSAASLADLATCCDKLRFFGTHFESVDVALSDAYDLLDAAQRYITNTRPYDYAPEYHADAVSARIALIRLVERINRLHVRI